MAVPKLAPYTGPDRRKESRDDDATEPLFTRAAKRIQMNLRTMRRIIAEGHIERDGPGNDGQAS